MWTKRQRIQWIDRDTKFERCEALSDDDIVSSVAFSSEERNSEECLESDEENLMMKSCISTH